MALTRALTARPVAVGKYQRAGQRLNMRRYAPTGIEWGQVDWGPPEVEPGEPEMMVAGEGEFDPAEYTVAGVQQHVTDLGDLETPESQAEIQRILDAEQAGENRTTLVSWLEARITE